MTATIVGLTLVVPGPATHRRRYRDGRPYWHCSESDTECQGHGRPAAIPPEQQPCHRGHVGAWKHNERGWRICTECVAHLRATKAERQEANRARFNNRVSRTKKVAA